MPWVGTAFWCLRITLAGKKRLKGVVNRELLVKKFGRFLGGKKRV